MKEKDLLKNIVEIRESIGQLQEGIQFLIQNLFVVEGGEEVDDGDNTGKLSLELSTPKLNDEGKDLNFPKYLDYIN